MVGAEEATVTKMDMQSTTNKDDVRQGSKAFITFPMHEFTRPRGSTIATYRAKNVTGGKCRGTSPDEVPVAESMDAQYLSSNQPSEVSSRCGVCLLRTFYFDDLCMQACQYFLEALASNPFIVNKLAARRFSLVDVLENSDITTGPDANESGKDIPGAKGVASSKITFTSIIDRMVFF
jgi:hypothetical protein